MKILYVLGADCMEGTERLSLDLAGYYAGRGYRQTVLFFSEAGDGPVWQIFAVPGVRPFGIPYQGSVIYFVRSAASLCYREDIDAVLTAWVRHAPADCGWRAICRRPPYIESGRHCAATGTGITATDSLARSSCSPTGHLRDCMLSICQGSPGAGIPPARKAHPGHS